MFWWVCVTLLITLRRFCSVVWLVYLRTSQVLVLTINILDFFIYLFFSHKILALIIADFRSFTVLIYVSNLSPSIHLWLQFLLLAITGCPPTSPEYLPRHLPCPVLSFPRSVRGSVWVGEEADEPKRASPPRPRTSRGHLVQVCTSMSLSQYPGSLSNFFICSSHSEGRWPANHQEGADTD